MCWCRCSWQRAVNVFCTPLAHILNAADERIADTVEEALADARRCDGYFDVDVRLQDALQYLVIKYAGAVDGVAEVYDILEFPRLGARQDAGTILAPAWQ